MFPERGRYGLITGEDRSSWASANPERLERLVSELRRRENNGCSDDELAVWLKFQTTSFGDSGKVLSVARGISTADAYGALWATSVWRNAATRLRILFSTGATAEFRTPDGRTFAIGETL